MRLIYSSTNPQEAGIIAGILKSNGIECKLEVHKESDWGSPQYGDLHSTVWVIEEDKVEEAQRLIEKYKENPSATPFVQTSQKAPFVETVSNPLKLAKPKLFNASLEGITFLIMMICTLIFTITLMTEPVVTAIPKELPSTPFISSPTYKALLFDYPKAYEIVDRLIKIFGEENLENSANLPSEGKQLIAKFTNTAYWQGLYQIILDRVHNIPVKPAPLFEKIREGEYWRFVSPAFLHSDILHLLFNMLWLAVLGKQIEQHIGKIKYILFIIIAAIFSNTCQYLVGGPNFIGFSGIVCAMLTFIWTRQKIAPWEGYPLEKSTEIFLLVFILAMSAIQAISFAFEVLYNTSISPGLANTAHLAGALIGAILGRIPYFSWKG